MVKRYWIVALLIFFNLCTSSGQCTCYEDFDLIQLQGKGEIPCNKYKKKEYVKIFKNEKFINIIDSVYIYSKYAKKPIIFRSVGENIYTTDLLIKSDPGILYVDTLWQYNKDTIVFIRSQKWFPPNEDGNAYAENKIIQIHCKDKEFLKQIVFYPENTNVFLFINNGLASFLEEQIPLYSEIVFEQKKNIVVQKALLYAGKPSNNSYYTTLLNNSIFWTIYLNKHIMKLKKWEYRMYKKYL